MDVTLHGKHLIAGVWTAGRTSFPSTPATGPSHAVAIGDSALVARAALAAEAAFPAFAASTRGERAALLEAIAAEIEARAATITAIAGRESGLPAPRLEGELARTTGQLRLFAAHIRRGDHLDRRIDAALPDRRPLPRPDLRLIQRPVGPVAVFGASNFPLAFSVAGGDTASALAAGCPVVFKGHEAHPGTSEIVAQAILTAIDRAGIDPGVFSLIHGGSREVGTQLVSHPLIQAVGFTGSLAGGRALFDLCAARPHPIPFFGELGAINPMLLLPGAVARRGDAIAAGWAASLTLGAGQFCTNPGVAVILADQADTFADATAARLTTIAPQVMLSDAIAAAYRAGTSRLAAAAGMRTLVDGTATGRVASPALYQITGADWQDNPSLAEEVFGPAGIIVTAADPAEMRAITAGFAGQLTATLHLDPDDDALAGPLLAILERKAGRILANGFPTGVEVCDAMVHGGPYPASTNFGATSVGTMAIRRWLRPVCFQDIPAALLPADLRGDEAVG